MATSNDAVVLPEGVRAQDLTPDPDRRPGVWIHALTGQSIQLPHSWRPDSDNGTKVVEETSDLDGSDGPKEIPGLVGRRIQITADGPMKDKKGMISEANMGEDARIIMDGNGTELGFDLSAFRFLSKDEVKADEKALKDKTKDMQEAARLAPTDPPATGNAAVAEAQK